VFAVRDAITEAIRKIGNPSASELEALSKITGVYLEYKFSQMARPSA